MHVFNVNTYLMKVKVLGTVAYISTVRDQMHINLLEKQRMQPFEHHFPSSQPKACIPIVQPKVCIPMALLVAGFPKHSNALEKKSF